MSRALVFGAGMLMTAYDAGVAATLARGLGVGYFDEVIASSGSVFGAAFLVANQPHIMEHVWRLGVDSTQLLNLWHPFQGEKFLALDYLIRRFQQGPDRMDIQAIFDSRTTLTVVLTQFETGAAIFARPTPQNIWDLQRGTCAVPGLYGRVWVDKYGWVLDGGLAVSLPLRYALDQGHDEVVVVYNRPENYRPHRAEEFFCRAVSLITPYPIRQLLRTAETRRRDHEALFSHPAVKLIRLRQPNPLRSVVDDDYRRLNRLIDLGVADALAFLGK